MTKPRLALVTGAASGIGRACLERLAADGLRVVGIDRDEDAMRGVANGLAKAGHDARGLGVDIRDRVSIRAALDAVREPVDVLVNNAGIYSDKPFMDLTEADFQAMLGVNLIGTFLISQEVLRDMPDGGRIINIASRSFMGARNMAHYSASKGAVVSMTRTMAMEFVSRDIAVNAIAPGLVETPILGDLTEERREQLRRLQPTGRMGTPDDIAGMVSYLAAPATGFVTGQVLVIDGGKSLGGLGV